MVSLSLERERGVPVRHTSRRLVAQMPPDFGPTARGTVFAEEPELQVKTTETGHIVCHLLLTNQAPDVPRPSSHPKPRAKHAA
ncbi:hypothetical protein QO002_003036 [Pararhizobium capsulatum DSM 1112]|uniref:Transposase n=1 Tax=Pararhizobium capsulatum DSM 1112 TaxID=1121113 RepID=A0ABU0BRL5_9HYPH|nr:hypothetical protein [Pararhizobium capsulatum DSM 1112]